MITKLQLEVLFAEGIVGTHGRKNLFHKTIWRKLAYEYYNTIYHYQAAYYGKKKEKFLNWKGCNDCNQIVIPSLKEYLDEISQPGYER